MTVVAQIQTPMRSVNRGPRGDVLGTAPGQINGAPLLVSLTVGELHIGWTDRDGPAFVIELNQLVRAAVNQMEELLGQNKERRL